MKIVFVCTGNTCRSPIAEAIFNKSIENKNFDATATSCGLYVPSPEPISENAKLALNDIGINFSHKSVQVSEEILKDADMIFGITQSHAANLCAMFPAFSNRIYCFPYDISDPYGADLETYKGCRDQIATGIERIIEHIKKNVK